MIIKSNLKVVCAYQIEYKYRTISLNYIPIHHRTDTRIRPNVFGSLYHFNSKVVGVAVLRQSVYHGIDQPERIFAEFLPHLPQLRLTGFQFFYALGDVPTAHFQFVEIIKQIKASGKLSGGYDRFRHIVGFILLREPKAEGHSRGLGTHLLHLG